MSNEPEPMWCQERWGQSTGNERTGKAYITFRSHPNSEYDYVVCSSYFMRGARHWTVRLETIDGGVEIASSDRLEIIPGELEARKQALEATIAFAEQLASRARSARERLEAADPLIELSPCRSSAF